MKCQCNMLSREDGELTCEKEADPVSGEAFLCKGCWTSPIHQESNMVPKRLPRREMTNERIAQEI